MADQTTLDAIETAELVIQVDGDRPAGDAFKLSSTLLALVTGRLATAKGKNAGATMVLASTLGASQQRQDALDRMAIFSATVTTA